MDELTCVCGFWRFRLWYGLAEQSQMHFFIAGSGALQQGFEGGNVGEDKLRGEFDAVFVVFIFVARAAAAAVVAMAAVFVVVRKVVVIIIIGGLIEAVRVLLQLLFQRLQHGEQRGRVVPGGG